MSRYDGEEFVTFTREDGLASNTVQAMLEDQEGHLWFGIWPEGVSRYDGAEFVTFTTEDGLADNKVHAILEDRAGHLWFGTHGGAMCRYDGVQFSTFTIEDGLAHNHMWSVLEDEKGHLWFGTFGGGVSRYDGQEFVTFITADGLADNHLRSMLEDREGHLWFGTFGGGVSRYDGQVFQSLSRKDGLVHNGVNQVCQDRCSDFWLATEAGLSRYRPEYTPPAIFLEMIADHRYGPVREVRLPVSQKFVIFEFQGKSLTTRPDGMAYVYRLEGRDADWQNTHGQRVEYQDLPLGEYTFQVRAVDRDLNYSETAEVQLVVVPDPRAEQIDELEMHVRERTRELQQLNTQLEAEIAECRRAEEALRKTQGELEQRVEERTSELSATNESLQSEISERQRAEEQLVATVQEKEMLLKEIHHRVKNNLQVVSSLLDLQSGSVEDERIIEMFMDSKNRVQSMSLIHERLYQSEGLVQIDFAEYIHTLATDLFQSYGVHASAIALEIWVDEVALDIDKAIPCGLIINELVSNSLKYAFPGDRKGKICIDLHSGTDDKYVLAIRDNGVGFPQDVDFRNTVSLGLRLVVSLAGQLGGGIELNREEGTEFRIEFAA